MRTAIYLRISQDPTGKAAGVARQAEDCVALADELGWRVVETYQDNDISASNGAPRPEYRRMLEDIAAGQIEAVIAWHTDRLYRRLSDLEELIPVCEAHHVAVRTCRAGELDLATPTGRMLARILGSVATHEGEQKADRWRRSYRQRREAGQWMASGPRTYGYNRDGTINPAEAKTVRRVAAEVLAGTGTVAISRQMQARGEQTTRGNAWTPTALRLLLTNPRVAGLVVLEGEIIGPGQWTPLLDRPTWERVQSLLSRHAGVGARPRRSLLSGLIVCGWPDCGRPLTRSASSVPIYGCKTDQQTRQHVTISGRPVEAMVESYARTRLADPKVRRALVARVSTAGDTGDRLSTEIDNIEAEIRELEAALVDAGSRSRVAIARAIDELAERLEARRAEFSRLTPVPLPIGDEWPEDIPRRSALIRLVVARVRVKPATMRGRFDPHRVEIDPA